MVAKPNYVHKQLTKIISHLDPLLRVNAGGKLEEWELIEAELKYIERLVAKVKLKFGDVKC